MVVNRLMPKARVTDKRFTVREAVAVMNDASNALAQFLVRGRMGSGVDGLNPDPRRKIELECGYLPDPKPQDYKDMWSRFGLAARITNLMPSECFAVDPDAYETDKPRDTAFEKKVKALATHPDIALWHECQKADALSRLGDYGGILLGFDDALDPSKIAPGYKEDGTTIPLPPGQKTDLMYMTALDQTLITIRSENMDYNPMSRRYGLPKMYQITFREYDSFGVLREETRDIHWSRVIHVAEVDGPGKIFATPILKRVYDQLLDVRKILGGSAEMFWKGGFPGIAATVDPRFIEAGIEVNDEEVSEDMQRYIEGLQRSLVGVGFQYTQLAPGVADPTNHLMMQFQVIAMTLGIPLRVFMGSEEAKLASGQDAKAWNSKVTSRQNGYLSNRLIRPLLNRLINVGVIPKTKKLDDNGFPAYKIFWPDVAKPDQNEQSTVADRRSASMMKFVTSGAYQMMQPSDFLRFVLGYEPTEIAVIMDNITNNPPEVKFQPVNVPAGAADSGVGGKPPSDSPVGAIK